MYTVPTATVIAIITVTLVTFFAPAVLIWLLNREADTGLKPSLIGGGCYLTFGLMLPIVFEMLLTRLVPVFGTDPASSVAMMVTLGAVLTCFGQLIAYRLFRSNFSCTADALGFGFGYSCVGAWIEIGLPMATMVITAFGVNAMDEAAFLSLGEEARSAVEHAVSSSVGSYLLTLVTLLLDFIVRSALSLIIWITASKERCAKWFPIGALVLSVYSLPVYLMHVGIELTALPRYAIMGGAALLMVLTAGLAWKSVNGEKKV